MKDWLLKIYNSDIALATARGITIGLAIAFLIVKFSGRIN